MGKISRINSEGKAGCFAAYGVLASGLGSSGEVGRLLDLLEVSTTTPSSQPTIPTQNICNLD